MQQTGYQVQLEVFTGPLDLLLHLIEQQELDITLVSLAQVTDQYLAYIASSDQIAPDDLAEFVTIAARLLLIKSRVLLPRPEHKQEEEHDVGDDLVRQLYEYRRFKQIAQLLERRDEQGLHAYARAQPPREWLRWEPKIDLSGISLDQLRQSLYAMLKEVPTDDSAFAVTPFKLTIDDKIAQIERALRQQESVTLASTLEDSTSRMEVIITLLAVLELIRHQKVAVQQHLLFGEIVIVPCTRTPASQSD